MLISVCSLLPESWDDNRLQGVSKTANVMQLTFISTDSIVVDPAITTRTGRVAAEWELRAKALDDFFKRCLAADSLDLKVGHLLADEPSSAVIIIKAGSMLWPFITRNMPSFWPHRCTGVPSSQQPFAERKGPGLTYRYWCASAP